MTDVADKLREARALIERGWTQGADARDKYGDAIDPYQEDVVCYCLNGALFAAGFMGPGATVADTIFEQALGLDPAAPATVTPLIDWNDAAERTQAEVLAAFDKAIELAEAQS